MKEEVHKPENLTVSVDRRLDGRKLTFKYLFQKKGSVFPDFLVRV